MKGGVDKKQGQPLSGFGFDSQTKLIFDSVFDFHGTLDASGHVLDLSGRIFEVTNTNPELLVGQQFSQTVFWQSSENTPRILDKALENCASGKPSKLLLDFRVSADVKRPVELSFQPLPQADGQTRIFVCAQSVSERKDRIEHYKRESEQLLFAAENAEIGLWFWDFKEDKIYSTPRCNELFEFPAYETLTASKFFQTVHPDDRFFVTEFLAQSRNEGTKYEEEFRLIYSDGTIEWVCAEGKSFRDEAGSPQRMIGVVRKITEKKVAAAELAKVHEREKKARDEAVEANRAKDFFLAFVSHELRSPLNAILGWSKILLTKQVDEETRKNALETIERSARFQTKLINDLVDSARVASGKLRLEYSPTNIYEIVKNSFQAQKPIAEARNISFEFKSNSEQISVFGDAGRLQQVFGNLISNALKFTPIDGRVWIEIRKATDTVEVTVSDSGHGIDPKALPNIFRQFSQGDIDQAKANAGLGLGLSIVKILVTKHGGFVQAESEGAGKGSKFTVVLPLTNADQAVPAESVESEVEARESLRGVRILVVEDDIDSREVLQLFLEQSGAEVKSVESAKLAIHLLAKSKGRLPQIIISDLAMPDEDGYSLISRIRKLPAEEGGTIPALALSAFTTIESRERAFAAGFQKYSTKPFEPELLVKEILGLLNHKA